MRFSEFSDEWNFLKLENCCKFFSGGTPLSTNKELYKGTIPFIRSGEIHSDKTELFISEQALKCSSAKMVNSGDLLLALYGATSGEIDISKITGAINQAILCIRTNQNNKFIKYQWQKNKNRILETYLQGGQGNLSGQIVSSLSFGFPTLEEQNKIVSLMDKIEERINTQNKIIRDLKAEFLFLLNSCFAGEKNATIGAYIKEESHRNKQNKEYPVFSVSNKRGFIPQNEQFDDREVASNDKTNYKIVSLNQFAYNPARINVGSIGLYKNETPCIISPMYNVFSVVSIDPFILELYFKSSYFINEMNKRLEGSVRMCLTIDGLKGIKFHLPSQTFLNSFSKAMDVLRRKIELEENLLSFYQTQKKYLLANLFI